MKISTVLSILIPFTFSVSVFAAPSGMKAGLWEHSFSVKSQSGKVEKAMASLKEKMANMPAEQRKMMEEVMAKQGLGVSPQANNVKVCISKEQADNLEIPQGYNQGCTNEVTNRTAKSVKMKFACKGSSLTSGEAEFTLTSPTAYVGKSVINTIVDEKPDRVDMDQKGKWLSANCGKINQVPVKI